MADDHLCLHRRNPWRIKTVVVMVDSNENIEDDDCSLNSFVCIVLHCVPQMIILLDFWP